MTTYNPRGLAVTIRQRTAEVTRVAERLTEVAERLEAGSPYGHDHAEEQLEPLSIELERLAKNIAFLAVQYTLTGITRKRDRGEWGA